MRRYSIYLYTCVFEIKQNEFILKYNFGYFIICGKCVTPEAEKNFNRLQESCYVKNQTMVRIKPLFLFLLLPIGKYSIQRVSKKYKKKIQMPQYNKILKRNCVKRVFNLKMKYVCITVNQNLCDHVNKIHYYVPKIIMIKFILKKKNPY